MIVSSTPFTRTVSRKGGGSGGGGARGRRAGELVLFAQAHFIANGAASVVAGPRHAYGCGVAHGNIVYRCDMI